MLTIAEIMTADVKTLRADQMLQEALELLHREHVRHIPIVDRTGALVGVLTDRDVKRATPSALVPTQREVWEQVVRDTPLARVMTREPTTIGPAATLADALRLAVTEKIGCLPVVEGGALVGIVTTTDLLRASLAAVEAP
jgi:CBS domain-containing protein